MSRGKTERNQEIMRLWAQGYTNVQIAQKFGINNQAVSAIIVRERSKLKMVDRDQLIKREIAFLDDLRTRAMDIANKTPHPLVAGKDGNPVIDPQSGEIVRDHSQNLAAQKEARATSQDLRRLCGLDQPVETRTDAVVRYEVVGINPEDI